MECLEVIDEALSLPLDPYDLRPARVRLRQWKRLSGLKITLYPEFRGCRMLCILIKNHLCSRRRNTYLDHELFYNNVVGSFIQAPMVEEILLMQ
jgi:hypothetical protein